MDVVDTAMQRLRVLGAATLVLLVLVRRPDAGEPLGAPVLTGLGIALALVAVSGFAHRRARQPRSTGPVATQIGVDCVLVVAALWSCGAGLEQSATLLLVVPGLVAAVRFRVLGAVACWGWCVALLAVREMLGWQPGDPLAVGALAETAVVLLVVTLPAAYLAEHLAGQLAAALAARGIADRRVDLLARLAGADREVNALTREEVLAAAAAAAEDLAGRPIEVVEHADEPAADEPAAAEPADAEVTHPGIAEDGLVRIMVAMGGGERGFGVTARVPRDESVLVGEALEVLAAQVDVALRNADLHAQLAALMSEMSHRAHHDQLTGLGNRAFLASEAERRLEADGDGVLLFVDLDGFKPVNDEYGHETGDRVLVEVGRRLVGASEDAGADAVIARLGGDEFALLVTGTHAERHGRTLYRCLLEAFAEPMLIDGHLLEVGASIGTARTGVDGSTVDDLLRAADGRMYECKHARRPVRVPGRVR
jgi:diguanylate cyclase (GGDEF)-like protein